MSGFATSDDIANRALQRVGATRIGALTDNTKNAKEVAFCYDKLRRAELRRNCWRFAIRRTIVRAVGTAPALWDSTLTYAAGAYVLGSDDIVYTSDAGANLNNDPTSTTGKWTATYTNPTLKLTFSAWATGTTYAIGQVVLGSDGRLYEAIAATTGNDPTSTSGYWAHYFGNVVATCYDSTTTYDIGEVVFGPTDAALLYVSTLSGNGNAPSTGLGWATLTATTAPLVIQWPAGTGPMNDGNSANVFVLPFGFLRMAPQDPSAGRLSYLGYPSNLPSNDWVLEGGYLISRASGPIMLRFVADIIDVTLMDDMFCEGLGCRIALEVCEPLTQSTAKLGAIGSEYKQFMGDARNVNGIEEGPTPPPLDDYIAVRA